MYKATGRLATVFILMALIALPAALWAAQSAGMNIYQPGELKPTDSVAALKPGTPAPDFTLPSTDGEKVTLSSFKGKKNVVLSFVPAAFTPVCSQQWPGYNIAKDFFASSDAVLIGISADNVPTLYAWTKDMGDLWFPVVSDFWPHGAVAQAYGVLRNDGMAERSLFVIDKEGVIRYADVHDINSAPRLEDLVKELQKLGK